MKKFRLLLFAILATSYINAQDTFSIVAVDTVTGEIGSAGASCIDETAIPGGALIISDVLPGRGAIHTQSYWNATNQNNAHNRMVEGMSPQEIIDWLVAHDAQNNPGVRQYGIVDFDSEGHARSAGFTGVNCMNYKNHITGPNYAIQGNILLGQQILDSIESRFLQTHGSFAERLMAALQGANVIGADTRCMENGTSSLSAFIRVARPNDTIGGFHCDLNVPSVPEGMEPIDSLQTLFDEWLGSTVGLPEKVIEPEVLIYPNPASERFTVSGQQSGNISISVLNIYGKEMDKVELNSSQYWKYSFDLSAYPTGIYLIQIHLEGNSTIIRKLLIY